MVHAAHPAPGNVVSRGAPRLRRLGLSRRRERPVPGHALGIGDRLFPHLGNPGYDVKSYDLSFTYPGVNDKPLAAVTTIDAVTSQRLERVNLDYTHGTVESVEVNGAPATFTSAGEDLVVTPGEPVPAGGWMRITVRHSSDPVTTGNGDGGWVRTKDGLAMANQADAAHMVFPCNDHPSDKAMFTIHVTAPDGYTAVANGLPAGVHRAGGSTTWTYRTRHPMATELTQVSIGRSSVAHREGPHGLPLRDVVPTKDRELLEPWLKKTPDQIAWMESKVGPYPFETYGLLMAQAQTGFELETQTLSLFERALHGARAAQVVRRVDHGARAVAPVVRRQRQPRVWSDLWLNEGHATWYEALYAEEKADKPMETRMKTAYRASDSWRAAGGPPAAPKEPAPGRKISIFRPSVYDGAALALYALRQEIGHPTFERLERTWVALHRDGTATTADFERLASDLANRDLSGFFRAWLHGTKTPPMPGHPDWKSDAPKARKGA